MDSEVKIKRILSHIDIALPGGNMSCHAFFNVIENFIRNSAKYMREDFRRVPNQTGKSLTTSIALSYDDDERQFLNIVIYDDKENASYYKLLCRTKNIDLRIQSLDNTISSFKVEQPDIEYIRKIGPEIIEQLKNSRIEDKETLVREVSSIVKAWQKDCLFEQIVQRLSSIRILDDDNSLNKENKGLKEMIFSSAWMRAYKFQKKTYSDIIYEIQEQTDVNKRLRLIKKYSLRPVIVLDRGEQLVIKSGIKVQQDDLFEPYNFGICINLPIFRRLAGIKTSTDELKMIQSCLDIYADIVLADFDRNGPIDPKDIFTRCYPVANSKGKSETTILREILCERFKGFKDYYLTFGGKSEATGIHDPSHQIKFDQHMKFHVTDLKSQQAFAYSDSVSGGDFTKTMNELFDSAISDIGTYRSEDDEYFSLKIKESALTRITIIDERLSDSMEVGGTQTELTLKNIRLLNYKDSNVINEFADLFVGNTFKDNSNITDFLSIHLGLVEKIIQSSEYINYVGEMSLEERAEKFMNQLRNYFGGNHRLFISIHSGRGNFSAELEGPLANYPFITMSSLESAFNNSKFLLAQLFYNTLYIGKGKINSIYKSENENDNTIDD